MKDLLETLGFFFLIFIIVTIITGTFEEKAQEVVQWVDGLRFEQDPDTVYVIHQEEFR